VGKNKNLSDAKGDCCLSVYSGGNLWNALHNALAKALYRFARQAGLDASIEPPRKLDGSRARLADVCVKGEHGWRAAGGRELWLDVTVVSAVCDTWRALAAATAGGAAAKAAADKPAEYRDRMLRQGPNAYYQPLAFESEGFMAPEVGTLLGAWAQLWAERRGHSEQDGKLRKQCWLNELASIHAKFLASCILERSKGCAEAKACTQRAEIRPPLLGDTDREVGR
jgi:hypothetical protein